MVQTLTPTQTRQFGRRQRSLPSGGLTAAFFLALVGFAVIDLVDRWHLSQGELAAEVLAHRFVLGWIVVGVVAALCAVSGLRRRELNVVALDESGASDGEHSRASSDATTPGERADRRSYRVAKRSAADVA